MPRLLLDEMYTGLREYLESLGWEVTTVEEVGLRGAKDRELVEYAKKKKLIVVTQDPRVADLAGLVGVECVLISNRMIAKLVDGELRKRLKKETK